MTQRILLCVPGMYCDVCAAKYETVALTGRREVTLRHPYTQSNPRVQCHHAGETVKYHALEDATELTMPAPAQGQQRILNNPSTVTDAPNNLTKRQVEAPPGEVRSAADYQRAQGYGFEVGEPGGAAAMMQLRAATPAPTGELGAAPPVPTGVVPRPDDGYYHGDHFSHDGTRLYPVQDVMGRTGWRLQGTPR